MDVWYLLHAAVLQQDFCLEVHGQCDALRLDCRHVCVQSYLDRAAALCFLFGPELMLSSQRCCFVCFKLLLYCSKFCCFIQHKG